MDVSAPIAHTVEYKRLWLHWTKHQKIFERVSRQSHTEAFLTNLKKKEKMDSQSKCLSSYIIILIVQNEMKFDFFSQSILFSQKWTEHSAKLFIYWKICIFFFLSDNSGNSGSRANANNHANQGNPNSGAYRAGANNHSNQGNPNNSAYQTSRGSAARK